MPTQQSLDEAAQAIGFRDFNVSIVKCLSQTCQDSITAHAETLDKLHGRKEVSEAAEFLAQLLDICDLKIAAEFIRSGKLDDDDREAIALIEAKFAELRGERMLP